MTALADAAPQAGVKLDVTGMLKPLDSLVVLNPVQPASKTSGEINLSPMIISFSGGQLEIADAIDHPSFIVGRVHGDRLA